MNKTMFRNTISRSAPVADTINEAGGRAYSFKPEHALAQYAVTGVFQNTFYTRAEDQLDTVKQMISKVSPEFIGKVAIYARQNGNMKDMPAFLVAALLERDPIVFKKVFHRVINDGKMLRNFVQIVRSGQVGRNSLGSMAKRMVAEWFAKRDADKIFTNSIGDSPSLADVIKLSHPRPVSKQHEALFAYLLDKIDMPEKKALKRSLPSLVKAYEKFKAEPTEAEVPQIPFQFIASLDIPERVWKEIAKTCSWQTLRMNLNTLERHGVMHDKKMVELIASRLADVDEVAKSKVFPYQLYTAYKFYEGGNSLIGNALQDAMELSLSNIPDLGDNVVVCPDVSGSMSAAVTGNRGTASSKVSCRDVAALVASAILRKNGNTLVLPFHDRVASCKLNPRDSVMTNAMKLANIPSGGTNCSAPLDYILKNKIKVDAIVFVSDNESWVDSWGCGYFGGRGNVATGGMKLWNEIKKQNRSAKMVCIDIQAAASTQFKEREDILNVGGFSDTVFDVINMFLNVGSNWVEEINSIAL